MVPEHRTRDLEPGDLLVIPNGVCYLLLRWYVDGWECVKYAPREKESQPTFWRVKGQTLRKGVVVVRDGKEVR